jgi:hypothetical protein
MILYITMTMMKTSGTKCLTPRPGGHGQTGPTDAPPSQRTLNRKMDMAFGIIPAAAAHAGWQGGMLQQC